MKNIYLLSSLLTLAISLTACQNATQQADTQPQANTELRDAIQQPIDRANAAVQAVEQNSAQQQALIDEATK